MYDNDFWEALDLLADNSEIVIDRPKGSVHPKYPECHYVHCGFNETRFRNKDFDWMYRRRKTDDISNS